MKQEDVKFMTLKDLRLFINENSDLPDDTPIRIVYLTKKMKEESSKAFRIEEFMNTIRIFN